MNTYPEPLLPPFDLAVVAEHFPVLVPEGAEPIRDAFETVVGFVNLRRAALRAARGKRPTAGVASFLFRLEPELLALQRRLLDGTWRPGQPFEFEIRDPKRRTISAAPFADRVVHHALVDPIEAQLDRWLVESTFACRRGKGQHLALDHAQSQLRRHEWFLKMDVQGFFPSLRHDVVLGILAEVIDDPRLLALCERIVRQPCSGRGLPIGNLTSQWFANLVLGRLDRWLATAGVRGYVRYMDDFIVFGHDKATLQKWRREVQRWLAAHGLGAKERATMLAPVAQGLPFLGFRVYRGLRRLRPENLRRVRARLRRRERQLAAGAIDEQQYASSAAAVVAHLRHGNTLRLRRTLFATVLADGSGSIPPATARTAAAATTTPL